MAGEAMFYGITPRAAPWGKSEFLPAANALKWRADTEPYHFP
jgi:hypothetical protein